METRQQFDQLLRERESATGFAVPELLHQYLVELLDSRLTRVDIIPDPSFGERYLLLQQTPSAGAFKDYADTCLFFTSLLPEYGLRRGLSMDYYCTLGISSYYLAGDLAREACYTQLGNWFYHLQKFLNSAVKPNVNLELFKIY